MVTDLALYRASKGLFTADLNEMTEYSTPEETGVRKVIQGTIDICGVPMAADFYYWEITRHNIDFILPYAVIVDVNEILIDGKKQDEKERQELTVDISYFLKNEICKQKVESIIKAHKEDTKLKNYS